MGKSFFILTALGLASTMGACAPTSRTYCFKSDSIVGVDALNDPDVTVDRAQQQIIERGKSMGLTVRESSPHRLVLVGAEGAALGVGKDNADAGIAETRRVIARAEFNRTDSALRYRYWIELDGKAPANTTAAHEKRMAAGLLAIREVFERPLQFDMEKMKPAR